MRLHSLRRNVIQKLKRSSPYLSQVIEDYQSLLWFRSLYNGSVYRAKMLLLEKNGNKVADGPFQGMRCGNNAVGSAYVPKLLGCYEEELQPVLEQIISKQPRIVVDIGCAEGYYAVGLALRIPKAQVYAFDCNERAQRFCRLSAKRNNVTERVTIGGLCDHTQLQMLSREETFILCDCEGAEDELLDPAHCPNLAKCDILVELHEFIKPGLTLSLINRFNRTHSLTLINTRERDASQYALLNSLDLTDRQWAVYEGRPAPMQWAYLIPHIRSSNS